MRTLKSTPLALTVGSQTWVRKVLREIGVPTLVVNSRSFRPIDFSTDMRRNFVQPGLTDAECPRLVVLRVSLHEEALTARRILLGRLDDGVLDTDHASQEVDVSWPQRDDLPPAHSGLNKRLDQQPMLRGQCAKEKVKFVRGDCA